MKKVLLSAALMLPFLTINAQQMDNVLSPRRQGLAVIAALEAKGDQVSLETALAEALDNGLTVSEAKPFIYNDPVDGSSTKNGLIVYFTDKSRIVYRLSGTGTNGATLRVYLERYETSRFDENLVDFLAPLADVSRQIGEIVERTGKAKADVLT